MTEIGLVKTALDTPVLWVDLDDLEQNITTLAAHFKQASTQWRPHIKGIKIPAIAHKLIQAGAIGVTCAKLGEAEVMAAGGICDILLANQIVGEQKLSRLAHLQHQAHVKVAVDSEANVLAMGQAATKAGVEIGVLVEVDTGMNRAGVEPGEKTVALSQRIHKTAGLRYMGVMAWEGHTAGIADATEKQEKVEQAVSQLAYTAELCRMAGLPVEIVSGGGTGTYKISPFLKGLTEIQAGGAIFNDVTYSSWGVDTTPCLYVRARVVSHPQPLRVIIDAGFKALPSWTDNKPVPVDLPHFVSLRSSAEHGTITLSQAIPELKIGDCFDFIVGYTDMTLFLHDDLYGIRQGVVEAIWPIQGRGKLR